MKISGRVVSKKPISLSRAAKLVSLFAAVENGSSPAVSLYLQRTSDAFNHLVQFHAKPKNLQRSQTENESERKREKKIVSNLDHADSAKKKKKEKRKRGEAESSGSKKSRAQEVATDS